jgi:hypothetical protein
MKNLVILFAGCFLTLAASAQNKVTKANVVGKWALTIVEMKDAFYFDVDKDSLALGTTITSQVPDASQLELVKTMTKSQLGALKSVYFQFNSDGTAEFNSGDGVSKGGTYVVDEEKSTITTIDKSGKEDKQSLPATMVGDKLKLTLTENAQGEFVMLLKKIK